MRFCLCKRVAPCAPRPPLRARHPVMPSGGVSTSGPCQWMCAHKYVLCLVACIALLCVYMIYLCSMAPGWWVSSEVRLSSYGYEVCLFKCVYSHPHPISVPPSLPSTWCITCDTHANIRYPHGHGPWLSRARRQHHLATTMAAFPNLKRHSGLGFLCVGSIYKWAFG